MDTEQVSYQTPKALPPFFDLQGVLTPHQAKLLIGNANQQGWTSGGVRTDRGNGSGDNPEVRSCEISMIDPMDPENEWVYSSIWGAGTSVNMQSFQFGIFELEGLQLIKYNGSTNDHYIWHCDECVCTPDTNKHRKLSCSIALNDAIEYEGGHLQISNSQTDTVANDEQHLSRLGNATFFPSFMRHRVTPVTKGTRYALVAWFIGPRWI